MDDYSINLYSEFFSNKITFKNGKEGLDLFSSAISRSQKAVVIKKSLPQRSIKIEKMSNEENLIQDFLKYILNAKIGDYLYLEINFNNVKCIGPSYGKNIDFVLTEILEDDKIEKFIRVYKLDKNLIFGTLKRFPLIPHNIIELQLNNLILEEILIKLKPELDSLINSNNIILSGEVVFSGWAGRLGIINILKKLPLNSNYNLIIDEVGVWKALLTKRDKEKWLYKLNPIIFQPDLLFVNSLKFENDKKIRLDGYEKQFVVNPLKYANIIRYKGNLFPELVVINTIRNNKIIGLSDRELEDTLVMNKESVLISKSYCLEHIQNEDFVFNLDENSKILIKQNNQIKKTTPLAEVVERRISVISVNNKFFETECVDKQLVHQKDIIGHEKKGFSVKPIIAKTSGTLILKYLKMGYLLIEDNSYKNILLSPCDGNCKITTKKDLINIVTEFLKIPIAYQIGENVYANYDKNIKNCFSNAKFYSQFNPETLSVKEIIENNIKLIIYERGDFLLVNDFINKNPILNDFLSIAIIDDDHAVVIKYIDEVFNSGIINGLSLDDGELKLLLDFSSVEYKRLKGISKMDDSIFTRAIGFERKKIYGSIIKSLSSTKKLIRFSQIESIENDSNLINQMFKL